MIRVETITDNESVQIRVWNRKQKPTAAVILDVYRDKLLSGTRISARSRSSLSVHHLNRPGGHTTQPCVWLGNQPCHMSGTMGDDSIVRSVFEQMNTLWVDYSVELPEAFKAHLIALLQDKL